MAAPKSVTKINKDGVYFESNVDWCNYTIKELCRAALKDVGKFIRREFKKNYYDVFKKRTGRAPKAVKYTVFSSENTKYPRIDIGLPHSAPGKPVPGFYSFFQEVGTSKQPKLGILTNTVEKNVATIVKIESQYLTALQDEAEALALINEKEESSDEEDD
jgi:hypothetical protein